MLCNTANLHRWSPARSPANVTVKTAKRSGSNISLAWNKVSKATGYGIYVKSRTQLEEAHHNIRQKTAKICQALKHSKRAYRKYNAIMVLILKKKKK